MLNFSGLDTYVCTPNQDFSDLVPAPLNSDLISLTPKVISLDLVPRTPLSGTIGPDEDFMSRSRTDVLCGIWSFYVYTSQLLGK